MKTFFPKFVKSKKYLIGFYKLGPAGISRFGLTREERDRVAEGGQGARG